MNYFNSIINIYLTCCLRQVGESTSRTVHLKSFIKNDGGSSQYNNSGKFDTAVIDTSKVETFVEIKRRFEEAAITNAAGISSVVPLSRASSINTVNFPNYNVTAGSNNSSGTNSPGGSINSTTPSTPRSNSKVKPIGGIMQQSGKLGVLSCAFTLTY